MARGKKRGPVVVAAPQKDEKGLVGKMATTAAIAGTATVAVAGTSAAMNAVFGPDDPQAAAAAAPESPAAAAPESQAAAAAAPGTVGLSPEQIQQLQQLAALKEQGVLTQEEFDAQKAKILATT